MEASEIRDTFCVLPFRHMQIGNRGFVRLCDQTPWLTDADGRPLKVYQQSIAEIWNSPAMREARRAMIAGQPIAECRSCWQLEALGCKSRRMGENAKWQAQAESTGESLDEIKKQAARDTFFVWSRPQSLELEVGNVCNLQCRMCTPAFSSRIEGDAIHARWYENQPGIKPVRRYRRSLASDAIDGVTYDGIAFVEEATEGKIYWTAGSTTVRVPQADAHCRSLEMIFSDRMPPGHVVEVRVNDVVVYRGCPLDDGLTQTWELSGTEGREILKIEISSSTLSHPASGHPVGLGVRDANLEFEPNRKLNKIQRYPSSRLPDKQHWFKEKELIYGELLKEPKAIREVYFKGGEPLLSKEALAIIDYLGAEGDSDKLRFHVTTNGTLFEETLIRNATRVASLSMAVSIDGIGQVNEYIRYPAKWSIVEENLRKYAGFTSPGTVDVNEHLRQPATSKTLGEGLQPDRCSNLVLFTSITFQIYNALNIVELFRFCDHLNYRIEVYALDYPSYLAADVMPPNARRVAAQRIREYIASDCKPENRSHIVALAARLEMHGDTLDMDNLQEFMVFTNDLDRSRGQSFRDACPELLSYIEEAGIPWSHETRFATKDCDAASSPEDPTDISGIERAS
jgi:pyruvate-formate lyase-activating enzyme